MTLTLPREREACAKPYQAVSFEAFGIGPTTRLLDPLRARSLAEALAETTARWGWDRGDRLAVREIGDGTDRLHVYAVRRKSAGVRIWNAHVPSVEHERWLEHVCTVDLNVVAGIGVGLLGSEVGLHQHRQHRRPDGARMERGR